MDGTKTRADDPSYAPTDSSSSAYPATTPENSPDGPQAFLEINREEFEQIEPVTRYSSSDSGNRTPSPGLIDLSLLFISRSVIANISQFLTHVPGQRRKSRARSLTDSDVGGRPKKARKIDSTTDSGSSLEHRNRRRPVQQLVDDETPSTSQSSDESQRARERARARAQAQRRFSSDFSTDPEDETNKKKKYLPKMDPAVQRVRQLHNRVCGFKCEQSNVLSTSGSVALLFVKTIFS